MLTMGISSILNRINSPDFFYKILIIGLGIFSIICGVALFRLLPRGRNVTIIYFFCASIFGCLYFSPIFHQQRIREYENRYKIRASEDYLKYRFDNETSKKEYLARQWKRVEEEKKASFNLQLIIGIIIFYSIIILYLFRSKVKEQFKTSTDTKSITSAE